MLNQKEFEYSNILIWKNWIKNNCKETIKIGVFDENVNVNAPYLSGKIKDPFNITSKELNSHGNQVCNIILQACPNAEIHILSSNYPSSNGKGYIEGLKYCKDNKIPLVNMSMNNIENDVIRKAELDVYNSSTFLVCASGNFGNKMSTQAQESQWFSVGAEHLVDGVLVRTDYSSYGEELDIMNFSGLEVNGDTLEGTSFSSPLTVGMIALYWLWFKIIYKRVPTIPEIKEFIFSNCVDLENVGVDSFTGHGNFILPKIIPEVKNMTIVMKIDSNDIYVDGVKETTTTPARLMNGSTYLPLRLISEKLKGRSIKDLKWNNTTKEIAIFTD